MSGSKSEATLVLLYDSLEDKATWAIKSFAMLCDNATFGRQHIIWEHEANYAAVAALAGPRPMVLVEEVQSKQGDENEKTSN